MTDPHAERQAASEAQAKALASAVRMRILRVCLHEPHTNREIAAALDLNPATALHHVRRLVGTGFLAAQPVRRGPRGSREVPYLATRLSWQLDFPRTDRTLVDAFLDDIAGLPDDDLSTTRMGLKVTPAVLDAFRGRLYDLLQEMAAQPSDPDGEAWSLFVAVHPDRLARRTGH